MLNLPLLLKNNLFDNLWISYIYHMWRILLACVFPVCFCVACKMDNDTASWLVESSRNMDIDEFNIIHDDFPYNMKRAATEWKMPSKLKEISGLTFHPKQNALVAINDEKGNLYYINILNGEVGDKVDFGTGGDYEGIAFAEDHICIVKSNGIIYKHASGSIDQAPYFKTRLSYTNNIEGLGFDKETNSLLLACKDDPNISKGGSIKGKAIYSYSLEEQKLNSDPVIQIRDRLLLDWSAANAQNPDENDKIKKRLKSFSPSGIAVHPTLGHFYILSSKGHMLLVVDRNGEIVHIEFLSKKIEQPEGICFDDESKMYISSEGVLKAGKIFGYSMKN